MGLWTRYRRHKRRRLRLTVGLRKTDIEYEERQKAPTEREVRVIRSVSPAFAEVLDYRAYRLRLKSSLYDGRVARRIGKWQKDLDVAMKSQYFQPSEPITILPFLQTFKWECDVLRIHEGAAMWLLSPYLKVLVEDLVQGAT